MLKSLKYNHASRLGKNKIIFVKLLKLFIQFIFLYIYLKLNIL